MINPNDMSLEVLNDIQKDKILVFCQDTMLFQAVKCYLLAVAYKHGVIEKGGVHNGTINYALNLAAPAIHPNGIPRSDEELGQNLRALTYAVSLIESGFKELSEMRKPTQVEEETTNVAE